MKIFLCGDTGRLNRGCEAIVRGTVEVLGNNNLYLATFAPEQNISMVKELGISAITYSSYPSRVHRMLYAGIRRINKKSLAGFDVIQKPLFRKMSKEDICLNIGGDTYCYQRPAVSMALNNYTHKNNIKNILWCCSIEKDKIQGEILKDLQKYDYIFAREQITVNNLLEKGFSKEKVIKVCDPAFLLKTKKVDLPKGFVEEKTVGINISDCVCYGPYKEAYDNVKYLINWILTETDMSVCLIPHVYSITDNENHDLPILKRLYNEISDPRISIVDKEYDCEQLKYIISKCRYFIGARTHSTLAAYSMKIPTLVIGYSVKSKGIATDLFGTYENYVLPFEELHRDDELLTAFQKMLENEDWIKDRYERFLPQYKKQLTDAVDKYILNERVEKQGNICDLEECSGCASCYNICSVNAISMQKNGQGFLCPIIDKNKCVNCGQCKNVCPVNNKFKDDGKEPQAFGAKNCNDNDRMQSSSGGVFKLLSEKVLRDGGVVCAPTFNETFQLKYAFVENIKDLPRLLGSKYVQCEIGDSYTKVLNLLEQGKKVLFSGAPCQVTGLKNFLKKDYENLITQDIICHGVPSPHSWSAYLDYRKKKACAKDITNIVFREKEDNGALFLKIEFLNGIVYKGSYTKDPFIKSYLSNLNLRTACLNCSFKQVHRCSDITLGDFWGVEKILPEMADEKGISLILVQSEKGQKYIEEIGDKLIKEPVVFADAIKNNSSYIYSTQENPYRIRFLSKANSNNFERLVKKYAGANIFAKVRRKLRKIFKR